MITVEEKQVKELITPCNIVSIDYVINSYFGYNHDCMYCYARFMKRFSDKKEA